MAEIKKCNKCGKIIHSGGKLQGGVYWHKGCLGKQEAIAKKKLYNIIRHGSK